MVKYDLINVPALLKVPDNRSVWMTHDPIKRSIKQVEKNYTGGSFLIWTCTLSQRSSQMKLTFRPRRSLLLSPDLSVWKWKNESTSVTTPAKTQRIMAASCIGSWWYLHKPHIICINGDDEKLLHILRVIIHFYLIVSMSHTHTHTISVTVPGLCQRHWMSVVGV